MEILHHILRSSDGHAYAISVEADERGEKTVYLSDEERGDVELPIDVFRQIDHAVLSLF